MASSNEELSSDHSFSSETETGNENMAMAADGPSDSRCPICLERIRNVAFLNPCFHRFCFGCILEWSDRKAECPLCKQRFLSFFHTIRSDTDFEEYIIRFENSSYGTCGERSEMAEGLESLLDTGILYEGNPGLHTQTRMGTLDKLMRHLGIRRSSHPAGISLGQVREQVTIKFRRALYQSGVRVRNVQSGGFYRDISANFFQRNPVRLNRLVPWLKRELKVLWGTHSSLINNTQRIILNNITIYDLDSQAFADTIHPYLLHYTSHFLHEFINFARSPFNIKAYDWRATYDIPFPMHDDSFQSYSSLTTSSSEEEEEEEVETEESEEEEEEEEEDDESATSYEEASWDEEILGSVSLGSDESVEEYFLPFGISDGELVRSEENMHASFQADSHLGAHDRHCPLHKCVVNQIEDSTPMLCKSIPSCMENSQLNIENADEEEVNAEEKGLRSHSFGVGTGSRASAVTHVDHLACSNQVPEPLQTPSQQQKKDSADRTSQEKDPVSTKLIPHTGDEIIFIEMLQPKAEDVLVIEQIELKTRETNRPEQQLWQGEEIARSAGLPSSTEGVPCGSPNQWEGGCFSCVRRP
ncbi:E3 ubiquitin-protein ligase Topors-like [Heteronotia binoei]|uniref:E3 ubiquitin-protein ligase Topors-like n=1 Tax=Heteronotia binoei TaxID=13085 RepID=UPI002931392B|nr:E3 ubiquitin-protein ligase Topors-like [Heteronotia binoei]XP_060093107.1 E3 ubiquitin-protein ligase Topors-like [Heteronotia binoei]XP_060093108.1 E3 ubiquitin-protein ligase Topors-like [Heteronotia binoei]XP_060093109.1 E3 ubiquitin-protein ligase Topors-like [Heteronotia binoei]